jgi:hypothetical protein
VRDLVEETRMVRISGAACVAVMMAGSISSGGGGTALARPSAAPTAILMQACQVVPGQNLEIRHSED